MSLKKICSRGDEPSPLKTSDPRIREYPRSWGGLSRGGYHQQRATHGAHTLVIHDGQLAELFHRRRFLHLNQHFHSSYIYKFIILFVQGAPNGCKISPVLDAAKEKTNGTATVGLSENMGKRR